MTPVDLIDCAGRCLDRILGERQAITLRRLDLMILESTKYAAVFAFQIPTRES